MSDYDHLTPGVEGYWPVVGVCSGACIRKGDRIVEPDGQTFIVEDMFTAKAAPLRVGIVVNGERMTYGSYARVKRDRWGTHSTLCDRCVR